MKKDGVLSIILKSIKEGLALIAGPKRYQNSGPHIWMQKEQWTVCRKCGIVQRKDGKNSPCQGVVKISLRRANEQDKFDPTKIGI